MKGYQKHEAFVADVRMYWKMFFFAFLLGFLLQTGVFIYLAQRSFTENFTVPLSDGQTFAVPFKAVLKCFYPRVVLFGRENKLEVPPEVAPFFRHEGFPERLVPQSGYKAVMDKYFGDRVDAFAASVRSILTWSCCAYLLSAGYFILFFVRSRKMSDTRFVRGAFRIPLARLRSYLDKDVRAEKDGRRNLSVCGLPLPRELETRHMLIMGTTGTGKSVLINQVIGQIVQRMDECQTNEKTIVYDVKGEFLSKHYRLGDLIFYPPDTRSLRWSFFNEVRTDEDIKVLSEIIFKPPKETNADPFWGNAAKAVFIAGLRYLKMKGEISNADIWSFFAQNKEGIIKKIKELPLEQQGALKHIESDGSGPAQSVISVLTEKIDWFEGITGLDGNFSFRKYISSGANKNLFLLNIKNYADTFRPLMTFVFDMMIRETLSLPDTNQREKRRIWFCIDEIGSLNQIGVLLDLLTVARSKGGCLIVANQDLGKVEDVYGRANTRTFYNNFNINFILRLNDPDTADFLSKSIGEQEVIKVMNSRQMSPRDTGDRKSLSDQDKTERVMLPSEFMNIPDFQAIAKVSGFGIAKTSVPQEFIEPRHPHFIDKYIQAAEAASRMIPLDLETAVQVLVNQPPRPSAEGEIAPPRITLTNKSREGGTAEQGGA